ncbi:aromatic-ring-hydroxylating dioxygenase subunit beta [Xenorhabdus szentirmaii]|uniref:Dioxygenase, hydroxylase small component n=2 Tax=Xenorhabdus szentirmaii TaxID=290112 RepID=W1J4B0_9GAMM|nr:MULTISPECIES: aromatic-ring-hydroxylating dioxygenase subunit beta [Xenorhabdus]MBD2782190.1 nuclear transport factor 2 family protein [Xenorhabdus sp. 38]MBD2793810.1 nuclear transport factor 2 family protein [Xenorhabdus sp. CUL]MBD2801117.1 nuclear transport factor 2 family protein [Xenorhabdus sp. M]MBD2805525.1 nuclear transport factor 2 family protein [Xenorhabdus sp. ZM]MBD2821685.1 nuclear transport factor 2 family protein [Xenorhabdus sp. 42]
MKSHDVIQTLTDLIYHEAVLLDEQDFDAWSALLAEEYTWWVPLRHDQPSPQTESSLVYEDHFVTQLRINRLRNARNFSQQPRSRSQHLIQRPVISWVEGEQRASGNSQIFYSESRGDREWHYAARLEHQFRLHESQWLISGRKTILLNLERPFDSLQLII